MFFLVVLVSIRLFSFPFAVSVLINIDWYSLSCSCSPWCMFLICAGYVQLAIKRESFNFTIFLNLQREKAIRSNYCLYRALLQFQSLSWYVKSSSILLLLIFFFFYSVVRYYYTQMLQNKQCILVCICIWYFISCIKFVSLLYPWLVPWYQCLI